MRQLWQDLSSGAIELVEVPLGAPGPHQVLVQQHCSLISSGTEGMLHRFGKAGVLGKALAQPERVKEVADKIQSQGLLATAHAIGARMRSPVPLGYSSAGVVQTVGGGVTDLRPGDRVAARGGHGEFALVPARLCAKVPEGVPLEEASAGVLGAVALHGVRLARPEFGETFGVVGLGLLGMMTAQWLRAHGVKVWGWDIRQERLAFAQAHFGVVPVGGLDEVERGVDGVMVCATTEDATVVEASARWCRQGGRVVILGQAPITLSRRVMQEREVSVQVSRAEGAGRHEPAYEDLGQEIPLSHKRWSAGRNLETALFAMARGDLAIAPLLQKEVTLEEAPAAYALLGQPQGPLGILIRYDESPAAAAHVGHALPRGKIAVADDRVSVIGAGVYATRTLLPLLQKQPVRLDLVVSQGGGSAAGARRQFGFARASTQAEAAWAQGAPGICFVLTRHDSHASLATTLLAQGKHVFVEKPLALDQASLDEVLAAARASSGSLTVGFNRRLAPMTRQVLGARRTRGGPVVVTALVNAGPLPPGHWLHREEQGGRILGEACHMVDLACALADAPVTSHQVTWSRGADPSVAIALGFEDGSIASVVYATQGSARFPKERVEVVCGGGVARIDNWRSLKVWDWPGLGTGRSIRGDKGHRDLLEHFLGHALGRLEDSPISLDMLAATSQLILKLAERPS